MSQDSTVQLVMYNVSFEILSNYHLPSPQCSLKLQIERWWRELHERLEKFFKHQLNFLKDQSYYDPHNRTHRKQNNIDKKGERKKVKVNHKKLY